MTFLPFERSHGLNKVIISICADNDGNKVSLPVEDFEYMALLPFWANNFLVRFIA